MGGTKLALDIKTEQIAGGHGTLSSRKLGISLSSGPDRTIRMKKPNRSVLYLELWSDRGYVLLK